MAQKIDTKKHSGTVTETKQIERDGVKIGIISGYIATWDLDRGDYRYRDQFERGAFAESIADYKARQRMLRFKDHHGRTIGGWKYETLIEDDKGLFGDAEVNLDVQQGFEAYSMAKQGVLVDFSIGFEAEQFSIDEANEIRTITRAIVWEGSIVDEPMNPFANVTDIKSIADLPEDKKDLFDLAAGLLKVYGETDKELTKELTDAINQPFIKSKRTPVIDGNMLKIDKITVKSLTERQLEGILSSNKASLTRQASTTLISYLNFQGMRDAVREDGRDAQKDSKIGNKLDELKQLLEKN